MVTEQWALSDISPTHIYAEYILLVCVVLVKETFTFN